MKKTDYNKNNKKVNLKSNLKSNTFNTNKNSNSFGVSRFWKITTLIIIALFLLFIVIGLFKVYHLKSSFVKTTQEQKDFAVKIATDKLHTMGINESTYKITVADKMRAIKEGNSQNKVLQVIFYGNSTMQLFLINVDSGEIILHSKTEIYSENWQEHQNRSPNFPRELVLPFPPSINPRIRH